jgi:hypothetical protein
MFLLLLPVTGPMTQFHHKRAHVHRADEDDAQGSPQGKPRSALRSLSDTQLMVIHLHFQALRPAIRLEANDLV